jgi:hypothetical protein
MAKRVSLGYWDVNNLVHYDSTGVQIRKSAYPYIIYKERMLFNLFLVTDSNLTALTRLSNTDVFSAAIADQYNVDSATSLMATATNNEINQAGDWAQNSSGQADETQGEISIQMDGTSAVFGTELGTSKSKDVILEIQAFDGASSLNLTAVFQIPIIAYNLVNAS